MNTWAGIGRWAKENELRYSSTGTAVLRNTIAINRAFSKDKETDFIDVTVFGKVAENTANYTGKGSLVGVTGRIQQDRWTTQEGEKRSRVGVVANSVEFLQSKSDNKIDNVDEFDGFNSMDIDDPVPF